MSPFLAGHLQTIKKNITTERTEDNKYLFYYSL